MLGYTLVFTGKQVEFFQLAAGRLRNFGAISASRALPDSFVDYALGMRQADSPRWMQLEDIKQASVVQDDNGDLIVTRVEGSGVRHRWHYRKELGFALLAYHVYADSAAYEPGFELINREFDTVDGLRLPRAIECLDYSSQDGQRVVVRRRAIRITNYELSSRDNTLAQYRIEWPERTLVLDDRFDARYEMRAGRLVSRDAAEMVLERVDDSSSAMTHSPGTPRATDDAWPRTSELEVEVMKTKATPTLSHGGVWVPMTLVAILCTVWGGVACWRSRKPTIRR